MVADSLSLATFRTHHAATHKENMNLKDCPATNRYIFLAIKSNSVRDIKDLL